MVEQKITAIMIIEVAGRPPEYLTESITAHIEKLNHIKDIKLISSKISEPTIVESEKDIYSSFAEVEIEAMGLSKLMDLIFDFMPSSIEIIEPSNIELNCQEATMFVNDLAGRLHKYDEVAKIARFQIQQLSAKLAQAQQNPSASRPQNPIQPMKVTMQSGNSDTKQKSNKKPKKKTKK